MGWGSVYKEVENNGKPELLLVVNEDSFFLSHRREVALEALRGGWKVTVVARDTGRRAEIESLGLGFVNLPVNPTGMVLNEEIKTLRFLLGLLRRHRNAVVHFVGLKNMLWGGLAARAVRPRGAVFAVSGLGTLFGERRNKALTAALLRLLRVGMAGGNNAVIFQNHDDESLFVRHRVVTPPAVRLIKGSGVDLLKFRPHSGSGQPLRVLFAGRMIAEKGVGDFIDAARLLKAEFAGGVEFVLCGGLSANPSALKEGDLRAMTDAPYIRWDGHVTDIASVMARSDVFCYPGYYREGVPKALLEASACGLPLVTCDSVGCRDTVEDGVNGFLVPPHRPDMIARRLRRLLTDAALRERMGRRSRLKAEEEYDVRAVAARHMEIYGSLISPAASR